MILDICLNNAIETPIATSSTGPVFKNNGNGYSLPVNKLCWFIKEKLKNDNFALGHGHLQ